MRVKSFNNNHMVSYITPMQNILYASKPNNMLSSAKLSSFPKNTNEFLDNNTIGIFKDTLPLPNYLKGSVSRVTWIESVKTHHNLIDSLLYPAGSNGKERMHKVSKHPIYNFLHRYYSYSFQELRTYSPGLNILLEDAIESDSKSLFPILDSHNNDNCVITSSQTERNTIFPSKHIYYYPNGAMIHFNRTEHLIDKPNGRYGWITLTKYKSILETGLK
eukprot:gene14062-18865_t